jgi:hypothetical protein
MKRWMTRVYGSLMTAVTVAVLLVGHATVFTPAAGARPCCQTCEERESMGNAACAANSHDSCQGGVNQCYADVQDDVAPCWGACIYCSYGDPQGACGWCAIMELDPHFLFCGGC